MEASDLLARQGISPSAGRPDPDELYVSAS